MKYWQIIGHTFYFVPLLLDFPSLVVLAHGSSTKKKSAQPRRRQTTTVLTVWRLKKSSRSLSIKSYIQFVQRMMLDAPCNLHDQLLKNTTKIPFPRTFSSQWKRRENMPAWQTNYGWSSTFDSLFTPKSCTCEVVQSTATCRAGLEQAARSVLARHATDSRSNIKYGSSAIFLSKWRDVGKWTRSLLCT